MIHVLRDDPAFVPGLDFVMRLSVQENDPADHSVTGKDGRLIGQNMFMKTVIDADSSFFLCKELIPGYLADVTGVYQTPQGYYVKDEEIDELDKGFPVKEKLKLPGQIFG